MDRKTLGKKGEDLAAQFLIKKGYTIIARNVRQGRHEIDLIALNPAGNYVFIEVKTRRGNRYGYPEEAVNSRKLQHMIQGIERWLKSNQATDAAYQIDVIAIDVAFWPPEIVHIEDVGY